MGLSTLPCVTPTAQTLKSSVALPASGAYESDPVVTDMVTVPAGARATQIYISYTRGTTSGQAAHKIFTTDGTNVCQVMAPDGTYSGVSGRASTSASAIGYSISVAVPGGDVRIGIASAEVGATGTPGSYSAQVTFE